MGAGAADDLAAASALIAGAANLQEALLVDHFAAAVAHGASDDAVVLFGAGALAAGAQIQARNLNIHAHALHDIFEIDFDIVAEIFAALGLTAGAALAASEQIAHAEQVAQDVAEIGEGGGIESLIGAHALHSLVAIAVIGGALLRVTEDAISFGGFLEPFFGRLIVGVAIRMVFHAPSFCRRI